MTTVVKFHPMLSKVIDIFFPGYNSGNFSFVQPNSSNHGANLNNSYHNINQSVQVQNTSFVTLLTSESCDVCSTLCPRNKIQYLNVVICSELLH